ncbi:hypothetical protein ACFPRL_19800 [Pseudoclavibacter helvolus]
MSTSSGEPATTGSWCRMRRSTRNSRWHSWRTRSTGRPRPTTGAEPEWSRDGFLVSGWVASHPEVRNPSRDSAGGGQPAGSRQWAAAGSGQRWAG